MQSLALIHLFALRGFPPSWDSGHTWRL